MHSMQRLLELARRMENAVASSALLANVELANIEELTLKLEVYKVFLGISRPHPDDLPDDKHCRLGQWYYDGEGRERFAGLPGYAELETPHRAVHVHARQAVTLYYEGRLEPALAELQAMENANLTVMAGMSRMLGKAVGR
ncbi:Chemoreceptor zinc-binding domain protein [compost metagenome]